MSNSDADSIRDALKNIEEGDPNSPQLYFDPATGEIRVVEPGEKPSPDAMLAHQTASEGFSSSSSTFATKHATVGLRR